MSVLIFFRKKNWPLEKRMIDKILVINKLYKTSNFLFRKLIYFSELKKIEEEFMLKNDMLLGCLSLQSHY